MNNDHIKTSQIRFSLQMSCETKEIKTELSVYRTFRILELQIPIWIWIQVFRTQFRALFT